MANQNYYTKFIDSDIKKYYLNNNIKYTADDFVSLKGKFLLDSGVSDPRVRSDMFDDLVDLRNTIQEKYPGGDFIISSAKRNVGNYSGHDLGLGIDIKPTGNLTWSQLYETIYNDFDGIFYPVMHNNMTPGTKNIVYYNPYKQNHKYSSNDSFHIDVKYEKYKDYKSTLTGKASNMVESNPLQTKGVLNFDNYSSKDNFINNSGLSRDDYNNLFGFSKDFNISNANFRPADSFNSDFLNAIGLTPQEYDNLFDFTQRVQERPSRPQSDNAFHNQFLKDIGLTQEQYDNLFDFTQRVHISDADLNSLGNNASNNSFIQDSSPPPTMMYPYLSDAEISQISSSLSRHACPGDTINAAIDNYNNGDPKQLQFLLSFFGIPISGATQSEIYDAGIETGNNYSFFADGAVGDFDMPTDTAYC